MTIAAIGDPNLTDEPAIWPVSTPWIEPDPLERLRADHPDIAGSLQKLVERQRQQMGVEVRAVRFEEAMDAAAPSWRTLQRDREFTTWLQSNPDQQHAARQPGARAALGVIQAYDAQRHAAEIHRAPSLSDALDGWAAN